LFDEDEQFSKQHPLNSKIKDTDLFVHGTSLKNYSAIQSTGFLLRTIPVRNYSISQADICFEKYYKQGKLFYIVDLTIREYCNMACRNDGSSEGVVLGIKGKELKQLGCLIYADWNTGFKRKCNSEGIPIDVDTDGLLPITILDCDIPISCLEVIKRVPFKG
jgi:hypothetical protein